jgi:hypothetical protein
VRSARVFRALLGVDELVIERVDVEDGGEVLVVHARPTRAARGRCGVCRRRCGGYDAGEGRRRWRALDAGTARVFIEADCSRVRCRESARCGRGGGLRDDAVRNCSRAEYSFVRRLCGNRYGARARLQRDIAVRRGLLPGVPALTKPQRVTQHHRGHLSMSSCRATRVRRRSTCFIRSCDQGSSRGRSWHGEAVADAI